MFEPKEIRHQSEQWIESLNHNEASFQDILDAMVFVKLMIGSLTTKLQHISDIRKIEARQFEVMDEEWSKMWLDFHDGKIGCQEALKLVRKLYSQYHVLKKELEP